MKKVIEITESGMLMDDGSVIELLFELDEPLTLEEAQEVYESSLKIRDSIVKDNDETPKP